jgi:hypothetical protein
MKHDILAGANLFYPPEPDSMDTIDIDRSLIEGLILKTLSSRSSMVAGEIADYLNLPYFNIVEPHY